METVLVLRNAGKGIGSSAHSLFLHRSRKQKGCTMVCYKLIQRRRERIRTANHSLKSGTLLFWPFSLKADYGMERLVLPSDDIMNQDDINNDDGYYFFKVD